MKIANLLVEETQEEKFENYILLNTLYGSFREADRKEFEEYLRKYGNQPKSGTYYLERKMSPQARKNFLHDSEDDLKRVSFHGEYIDVEYSLGFSFYALDLIGPPPFKFKRNDEIYNFVVFNNCSTLTEYPSWFPNHISQYQQVGASIKSFKNIHKVIESCGSMYFGKDETIRNVPYLAEIKNLNDVEFSGYPELTKSVNKYLQISMNSDRSIRQEERSALSLQEHLLDEGFETFA